jgi:hypothetical protein
MTYVKQMQRIVDEYRFAGLSWPTSAKIIADWAISSGKWELPAAAIRRRCADDIAAAMREEYMTDRRGRRVRLLHPAPLPIAWREATGVIKCLGSEFSATAVGATNGFRNLRTSLIGRQN